MTKNQFGFMSERSTIEPIHLLRQPIEKYREQKQNLHMVFIDIQKAYNKVPKKMRILKKKDVSVAYIEIIKNMYENVITRVKILGELIEAFT